MFILHVTSQGFPLTLNGDFTAAYGRKRQGVARFRYSSSSGLLFDRNARQKLTCVPIKAAEMSLPVEFYLADFDGVYSVE